MPGTLRNPEELLALRNSKALKNPQEPLGSLRNHRTLRNSKKPQRTLSNHKRLLGTLRNPEEP